MLKIIPMKINDILNSLEKNVNLMSPLFARMIHILTEKMMIATGDNVITDEYGNAINIVEDTDNEEISDEIYEKLSRTENFLFNSFANLIKAKEALGFELEFSETMVKNQYDAEMSEIMEMYREFRNTEEILNDGEDDTVDELDDGEED